VEVWRRALDVNLTAVFVLTQACAAALRASGHGSVIVFGSTYGVVGPDWRIYAGTDMGNAAGYAASKGGAIQLSRWLATTLAPDVRVNALTPGGVARDQPQSFQDAYAARTPLGRMAAEEDYKGAAVFLASDLSRYVTGHNLIVDGGWTAW
jgi:NAD(P)-dependent dehydrogenase (short-subunit alcohol dehydrogenase family)